MHGSHKNIRFPDDNRIAKKNRTHNKKTMDEFFQATPLSFATSSPEESVPKKIPPVSPFDKEQFMEEFRRHQSSNKNPKNVIPELQEIVDFIGGLDDDDKMAIYYYTSNEKSSELNLYLLHGDKAVDLDEFQLECISRLRSIFERVPALKVPIVTYRGFAWSTLSERMFNSSALQKHIVERGYFTAPVNRLERTIPEGETVHPSVRNSMNCCIHKLYLLPGTRVLYFPSEWSGITIHNESEILIGPDTGFFIRVEDEDVIENNFIQYTWVFESTFPRELVMTFREFYNKYREKNKALRKYIKALITAHTT